MADSKRDAPLVVVVGGGYGGIQAARGLESQFNVLVLERRDALYHTLGAIRGAVDQDLMPKLMIPYTNALSSGKVVKATVTRITKEAVYIEDYKEPIYFDYLVVATGMSHKMLSLRPHEHTIDSMLDEAKKTYKQISEAQRIVLVGAGAYGCEAAGEILRSFPDKDVTLVARRKHVLTSKLIDDELGKEFEKRALAVAKKNGFKFRILTERSVKLDDYKEGQGFVETNVEGEKLECDLMIRCAGNIPHEKNIFGDLEGSFDEESGLVNVDSALRVQGHKNIFALGDITNQDAVRTMRQAIWQARHVAAGIKSVDAGQVPADYTSGRKDVQMITFGEWTGASVVFNYYLTQRIGFLGEFLAKKVMGRDAAFSGRWRAMRADKSDPKPEYKIHDINSEEIQDIIQHTNARITSKTENGTTSSL